MNQKNEFAEVIESSLMGWTAQSWKWNICAPFGSLVIIEQKKRTVYGIVHQIKTGSLDPVRYPFAYQKTEEELLQEQPQIFEFLKTTFSCLTLGYKEATMLSYQLAPEPPSIHAFIKIADAQRVQEFYAHNHYLHLLFGFSNQIFNIDELLLALLKSQHSHGLLTQDILQSFVQTLSLLLAHDYRRLKLFLQRLELMLMQSN